MALRAIAVTAVVLLLATWGFIALRAPSRGGAGARAELDPRHIAVLYFDQRPQLDSLGYLADGITEELIHELSGFPRCTSSPAMGSPRTGARPCRRTASPGRSGSGRWCTAR